METTNETERKDEGEPTPEELQEKSDVAKEAQDEIQEGTTSMEEKLEQIAMRDISHALGVHRLIMSAFESARNSK